MKCIPQSRIFIIFCLLHLTHYIYDSFVIIKKNINETGPLKKKKENKIKLYRYFLRTLNLYLYIYIYIYMCV